MLLPGVSATSQGYMTVSFHDTYYQAAAARFPDQVPPLTTTQQAALALFNETAGRADVRLDCWLEPGDMQFLNNHNTVHTRSQFIYWEVSAAAAAGAKSCPAGCACISSCCRRASANRSV